MIESFKYDTQRCECLYYLITYYYCNNMSEMAYSFYSISKDFIENKYLKATDFYVQDKLFVDVDKINFYVPYYMILVADKLHDYKTIAKMFQIIMIKKTGLFSDAWIGNVLYNLQFFINYCILYIPNFIDLLNEYFRFLDKNEFKYHKYEFLLKFETYNISKL